MNSTCFQYDHYDMLHSTRTDRERLAGSEPAGRFSILSVYQVQKLASDKAQKRKEIDIMSDWKKGIVGGGALFCRKKPQEGYDYWGKFPDGTEINVRDCGKEGWYETRWNKDDSKVGYVMRDYIDVNVLPAGLTQVPFYPSKAVEYADHHSQTTAVGKLCTNRNKTFGSATSNDCANFVSQCLCAGGLPMFNGWSYNLPGIPAGWKKTTKWSLTESGMKKLTDSARAWMTLIDPTLVKPGDVIYTYKKNNAEGKKYTHEVEIKFRISVEQYMKIAA